MTRIWIHIGLAFYLLSGCEATGDVGGLPPLGGEDATGAIDDAEEETDWTSLLPNTSTCVCLVDADCTSKLGDLGPCRTGVCEPELCQCVIDVRDTGTPCTDDDLCTEDTLCEGEDCVGGVIISCEDGNFCTDDLCEADFGCVFPPHEGPCEDGNLCTEGDLCQEGLCVGMGWADCDDSNTCTANDCDPQLGCVAQFVDGPCIDGDLCTVADFCVQGECEAGSSLLCEDNNPCTDDNCDPSEGCEFSSNASPCDDGDFCTLGDVCADGQCVSGSQVECNDSNACTQDTCDVTTGCVFVPVDCDDGDVCTEDNCSIDTGCEFTTIPCNDGNKCTDDACKPDSGCKHVSNSLLCDDGEPCTYQDICEGGECVAGTPHLCDDGDACTEDSCEFGLGCVHAFVEGVSCDDGNSCTGGDVCTEGGCIGEIALVCDDGNPCTSSTCVAQVGCVHVANENACDDGNVCTTGDQCQSGVCAGTGDMDCDDGNVCTNDGCIPMWGCFYGIDEGLVCNDGLACNGEDVCVGGECVGTPCPCQSDLDCSDDGNFCNGVTTCDVIEGSCVTSPPLVCEQTSMGPCESAVCQPQTGECVTGLMLNGASCNDGDLCSVQDICLTGVCLGTEVVCDDDNPCTLDQCDSDTGGCDFEAISLVACDDGDPCTVNESCVAGQCVGGDDICGVSCVPVKSISCGAVWKDIDLFGDMAISYAMDNYSCVSWAYPGPEIVYSFVAEGAGMVEVLLYDGEVSADILVLADNGECDPDTCIAFGYEKVSFAVEEGESFLIVVEATELSLDAFSISFSCKGWGGAPCASSSTPGCDGCLCEECVCEAKPECCTEQWSEGCVDLCVAECDGECEAPAAPCCFSHLGGGCTDASCEECVCSMDSFCCDAMWDLACVMAADQDCKPSCDCKAGVGNCCDAQEEEGCDDVTCQACVCDLDPYCCSTQWDMICVNFPYEECTPFCECSQEGPGSCCAPKSIAGCENASCEQCVCEWDQFCCAVTWDGLCVAQAQEQCDDECQCKDDACCDEISDGLCEKKTCSDCVCSINAACCSSDWSVGCGQLAQNQCAEKCECAVPEKISSDCCMPNGTPGCSDPVCQDCVCEEDAFCCEAAWDMVCGGAASDECEDECLCKDSETVEAADF